MAENNLTSIIQFKRGTAAELASYVPSSGEPVFATDLKLLKVGDGQNFFEDIVSPPSEASVYYVRNDTGSTIYKGQAVYASGTQASGKIITIDKYIADGTIDSRRFLGLVKEDIAHGAEGEVVHFGHVTHVNTANGSNINSTGADFSQGDILYASPTTAGTLTATKPVKAISVAFVLATGNNGEVFVRPHVEQDYNLISDDTIVANDYDTSNIIRNWLPNVNAEKIQLTSISNTDTVIRGISSDYEVKKFTLINKSGSSSLTLVHNSSDVNVNAGNHILSHIPVSAGQNIKVLPSEEVEFTYDATAKSSNGAWRARKTGVQSNVGPIENEYGSAVASGVYNLVIVNQDTYNNITKDPNTIYFVPSP